MAWGDDGHRVVCRIAYLLLDTDERAEIDRLTRTYRRPDGVRYTSFPESCLFADTARLRARDKVPGWVGFAKFDGTHYFNVARTTRTIAESQCGTDCILRGIRDHGAAFANRSLSDRQRAEALLFLSHWIGDIHQPLHISYRDDIGGNAVTVGGGFYRSSTLHSVWDTGIIRRSPGGGNPMSFAGRLADRITAALRAQWLMQTPLAWAQESYAISTTPEVDYCEWTAPSGGSCRRESHTRTLGAAYQKTFQDDVETRLQQAGVRLAAQLRAGLGLH
jgi:hypothetical protein